MAHAWLFAQLWAIPAKRVTGCANIRGDSALSVNGELVGTETGLSEFVGMETCERSIPSVSKKRVLLEILEKN